MKAGQMSVSCGPFVELSLGGVGPGALAPVSGDRISLTARVAAPSWMDTNRLEVVVDGKVVKTIALPPPQAGQADRFSGTVTASVTPGSDGWVLLIAAGDRPHDIYGQGAVPFAFTNPILLDGNGDQRWTPGQ
jgi:hypothetical protein